MKMDLEKFNRDMTVKETDELEKELKITTRADGTHPFDQRELHLKAIDTKKLELKKVMTELENVEREYANSRILSDTDFNLEHESDEHFGRGTIELKRDINILKGKMGDLVKEIEDLESNYKKLTGLGSNAELN